MWVEKFHACLNHCILFHGETFKSLDKCPRCGASWYKNNDLYDKNEASMGNMRKKGGKKVVQGSQPLEDTPLGNDAKAENSCLGNLVPASGRRLRRIFVDPKKAALMTWWDDKRKVVDDVIAHPADGTQW
jgi:hypothetical protein